ncbi:cupin domain-containing protein [Sphingomonas sp. BK069]|uniref:cupin domain-containing protein n=1 Tax=Sphingomonas sp. BK069 TaxID=2586979 RepID=UPI00161ABD43|nr:cupin domain-containing protein [Sphingomonas sp. BK069]MBB3348360.1 mannose-6-phosphate isomerase-like protein (cupin superfamily) [Sphingomonas sp. BK069]
MTEDLWFTTARLTIHLSRRDSAGGISLIEHAMAKDFAVPLHVHDAEDENFFVLQGRIRMSIGDELRELGAGEAASVPAGLPHSFRVVSEEARFLTITNGSFEEMVRSVGRPAGGAGLPPQVEPTHEEIEALVAACRSHGIDFVGPPVD